MAVPIVIMNLYPVTVPRQPPALKLNRTTIQQPVQFVKFILHVQIDLVGTCIKSRPDYSI